MKLIFELLFDPLTTVCQQIEIKIKNKKTLLIKNYEL